jgi:hypothetical protein
LVGAPLRAQYCMRFVSVTAETNPGKLGKQ